MTTLVTLQQLVAGLNAHLRERLQMAEDLVVLSPPREPDGSVPAIAANRLLVFLAEVRASRPLHAPAPSLSGERQQPAQALELLVVCAASFSAGNYADGLRLLGLAMDYLADTPVIEAAGMRINLVSADLSLAEMQSLWSLHGGISLPAMCYCLRTVAAG